MKALKLKTILRHVFIEGNADNRELGLVAVPIILVVAAIFFIFGNFPKH